MDSGPAAHAASRNDVAVAALGPPWFKAPMIGPAKARKKAARQERLQAALRENLKRRKAQARGRDAEEQVPDPDERKGREKSE
jgi:hypothetical protein